MNLENTATVVKHTGSHYMLSRLPEWNLFPAVLRGRIRLKGSTATNPVAVGDVVVYESDNGLPTLENPAVIKSVEERRNYVIRKSANLSRQAHIIAANIDQAFIVVTLDFPEVKLPFLDRILVTCEVYNVHPVIVLNKTDLFREAYSEQLEAFHRIYEGAGYRVMEVSAPLVSVHPLHAGESLGYGRTYVAASERLVGWVAIGYADGYRRNPSPGTCMCVNGVRVPVIGRVAMQMTCVDLTDLPVPPAPGDTVYVMGGPGDAVSAQNLAAWWGTIPYEVTCLLGKNRLD